MSTFGGTVGWVAMQGGTSVMIATQEIDKAEARGAPASTVQAWRDQLVEYGYDGTQDVESINAMAEEASGWSAAGNAGTTDTQVKEYVDDKTNQVKQAAADLASSAGEAASSAVTQVKPLLIGVGVIVFGLVVLAILVRR